jgi:putative phage-type endonuclease
MTFDYRFDRRSAIGASELGTVMDISPWGRPSDVWVHKRCGQQISRDTFFTRRGNDLEWLVKQLYEKETRHVVLSQETTIRHPQVHMLSCTPDGWIKKGVHGLEIKTVFGEAHQGEWRVGEIPLHYILQVQISMEITGADKWDLCAYLVRPGHAEDDDPPGELVTTRIYKDQALCDMLVAWSVQWWAWHVEDGVPVVDTKATLKDRIAGFRAKVDSMRSGGQAADLRRRMVQSYVCW